MTAETLQVVRTGEAIERAAAPNNIISLSPTERRYTSTATWQTYLDMYKTHPLVRAAIDKIAKASVSSGYQFLPRDSTKPLNVKDRDNLKLIFDRSRGNHLLRQTYTDLLIYGDCFWHVEKTRNGAPYQIRKIMPQNITIIYDTAISDVSQYIIIDVITYLQTAYPADEFIHFKTYDPYNDIYGLSPLESLKATVTQDLYAQSYNAAFFENSAQTGIVFNMRGASNDEVVRNREFLKNEYSSPAKAHKPLLLEGDVSVSKSVSSPAEMEFIQGREFLRGEILAVLDIPATKIGGTHASSKANSSEDDKAFRVETIQPLQAIVEEGINEQLIWSFLNTQETVFEHNEIDMRDEKERMDVDIAGETHGLFTINDLRSQRGMAPVPGGDEAFIQTASGIVPVKDISTLLEQQQQQAQTNAALAANLGGSQPNPDNSGTGVAQTKVDATGLKQTTNKQPAVPVPTPDTPNAPTGNQKKPPKAG